MLTISVGVSAQDSDYVMSSYLDEGFKAPNTHYIGEAWLNRLLQADDDLAYNITKATFKANSTLDWHKHDISTGVNCSCWGEVIIRKKERKP